MTRGEASHSPLPSIMDRFSGPSLGRALGRGGPRPSLLFPLSHPPRSAAPPSGSLDRLSPPKVCEPLYSCAPHVKIDLNLTDSHPVGTIDWGIVMSGTVCNVGLPSATMTARGSEMLSVFDQQLEVHCGTQCTISTNYSITASWDPPIPFTPVQHFGTSLLALSGGPIKCEGCERLAVPTGQ